MSYRIAILRNEVDDDHIQWVKACDEMASQLTYDVVDITQDTWLEQVLQGKYDGLLTLPSGWTTQFKVLYDERTGILDEVFGIPMFPSHREIMIYENKKYLSYWLKANGIPHPRTNVFYHKEEALRSITSAVYPLVAKSNVGAGGSGVRILRSRSEAESYIKRAFSVQGIPRSVGPKWFDPALPARVIKKLMDPSALKERIGQYRTIGSEVQRDQVLFQEFIPHTFEWRAVRIGDSYFAHKKVLKGDKASGSLIKEYGTPPLALLDFVRKITDTHQLYSQAIDIFESPTGDYLVNEMQCIFGQSDPHQMIVDGVPGRYLYQGGAWVFEAGEFNKHESHLLRLQYFLGTLERR